VTEDARDGFLAFRWAEELNEWVRRGGAITHRHVSEKDSSDM
jgi:hypothetical protein